ncbi:hypothetical protein MNBD_GAMMA15-21 [hydrothermal vent metagenome]|uniref:Uncharacterized protein n=1 Tax=hydrothermal vent metagenome TaxID=652676 RepID=A0A3B0Z4H2_9ZZZZ
MDKTNILVVGDEDEAAALLDKRGTTGIRFSRYTRDNDKTTVFRQPGRRYDWLLVNVASFGADEKDLIQSLRATGFFIPTGSQRQRRSCGVEWLADGSMQMHCCMQSSAQESCGSSQNNFVGDDSVVFEFQAPVKRVR